MLVTFFDWSVLWYLILWQLCALVFERCSTVVLPNGFEKIRYLIANNDPWVVGHVGSWVKGSIGHVGHFERSIAISRCGFESGPSHCVATWDKLFARGLKSIGPGG